MEWEFKTYLDTEEKEYSNKDIVQETLILTTEELKILLYEDECKLEISFIIFNI